MVSSTSLLNCAVCENQLIQPVTLSCGFTVCLTCLPSKALLEGYSFVCPVAQCTKESHLFGPDLFLDYTILQVIEKDFVNSTIMDDSAYNSATTALQCSIGNHLLEHPVTNHCGHTFCKVCLLQYKILNDACNKCQKRLPSYQFIQKQTPNILLNNLINIFNEVPSFKNIELARANQISNVTISFSKLNQFSYKNIPVYLSDFAVLPSQKLRIPIYTEQSRLLFQKALIICKEYQCLCLGIVNKDKTNKKGRFGTMVKVTAIEQRANDMLVNVVGMDRFKVVNVNQEAEDFIAADLDMQFENYQDLENIMTSSQHWTERKMLSPPSSPKCDRVIVAAAVSPPSSPPHFTGSPKPIYECLPSSSPIKLSNRIYDFINDLSHSTPSNSFCSTVEGLLGPVWLDSVQGLHGPLPAAENPVAMCWWAAVVLPVSNSDRYHLLETISLEERLTIILSWINDLKSQWGNCRRTAINSATKVGL
ncbi:hypothetical protein INT48_000822 [Thamnidium elegans]|uniref:RING-type domain-containing protein n=1 Tax=Thamnidium elegans TaxID=101142 RepID=A0A8H7SWK5_9FUNG|nr:hypothetical protein INT48_000822 [Thamnidium elegans]